MKRLLISILLLVLPAFAVNKTVKAGGGGDFTTIQACATAMANGGTCTVYAGTYPENVTVPAGINGSVKIITINGNDVVNVYSFTLGSYTTLIGGATLRPTVTGMKIQPAVAVGTACVTLASGATNVHVSNTNQYACGNNGMLTEIDTASYVWVQNNTFSYACGTIAAPDICHAIVAVGDNWLIEGNDFSHVNLGVQRQGSFGVVRNNTMHDVWGDDPNSLLPNHDCVPSLASVATISGNTATYSSGDSFGLEFPDNGTGIPWVSIGGVHYAVTGTTSSTVITLGGTPPSGTQPLTGGHGANCHTDFWFAEPAAATQFNLVEGNTIYNQIGRDGKGVLAQGESCAGLCHDLIVRYNIGVHFGDGSVGNDCAGSDATNPCFYAVKTYNNTWADISNYGTTGVFGGTNVYTHNSTNAAQFNDIFYYPQGMTDYNPYYTTPNTIATFARNNNLAFCVSKATALACGLHGPVYGSGAWGDDASNIYGDPLFTSYSSSGSGNLALGLGSPARQAGTFPTTVTGGCGTSTLTVDSGFFQAGNTTLGVLADVLRVGATNTYTVSSIADSTHITFTGTVTCSNGDGVYLYNRSDGTRVLFNTNPDLGALQAGLSSPTCTLSASPAVIKSGTSSTLTFTPANTPTTCSVDNGVGSVNCAGATPSVSPTTLTTYTATVSNAGGSNTCTATVTIGGSIQGANTIRTANTVMQ